MSGDTMNAHPAASPQPIGGVFDLGDPRAYQRWREWKLAEYPRTAAGLVVSVADPFALTAAERSALGGRIRRANMAVYALAGDHEPRAAARAIGCQLGLERLDGNLCADDDGLSALQVMPGGSRHEGYIPYTDRPLNWHTDGYYNTPARRIRGMLLHCASPAAEGGENALMDHEIAYILLRDADPEYIAALQQPDAMTIPANVEEGVELRPARSGPVFSLDPATGCLHMRYTARARNVVWKRDARLQAAVALLGELLTDGDCVLRHRLAPGQGLVCNNVLHNRSAFRDAPVEDGLRRLIYRARYYDRIALSAVPDETAVGSDG